MIFAALALVLGLIVPAWLGLAPWSNDIIAIFSKARPLPAKAQIIDPKSFLVLDEVLPPLEANATTVRFILPWRGLGR